MSEGDRDARLAMNRPGETEADTLPALARIRADHPAILYQDRTITYAQFAKRTRAIAFQLITDAGIQPGDRVAIAAKNCPAFYEMLYAAAMAGAIAVPINWRLSPREISAILTDAKPAIVFAAPEFLVAIEQALTPSKIRCTVSELSEDYAVQAADNACTLPQVEPASTFMLLYTSGTTGTPKGVRISHASSMAMRRVETSTGGDWTDWSHEDVAIVTMPNFHVSGAGWALQWFARGATCLLQEQVDPAQMLAGIEKHNVTHLFAVPTVLDMMLSDPSCAQRDTTSLKLIHYGGAPITPTLLRRCMDRFGCRFVQYYGMTETNGVVSVLQPDDHDPQRPERLKSVGQPYPLVDLRIVNPQGDPVPQGVVGEVAISSPARMTGYWGNGGENTKVEDGADAHACHRSGDAGYFDEDGYLYLVDRIKDMIVTGGENVYPIEVERLLAEHPAVASCAVIGVPDPRWGEAVAAVVVARGTPPASNDLIASLRGRLAGYKIPKSVTYLPSLPCNASGKVLKRELRQQFLASHTQDRGA